jgi:hypothetical protein
LADAVAACSGLATAYAKVGMFTEYEALGAIQACLSGVAVADRARVLNEAASIYTHKRRVLGLGWHVRAARLLEQAGADLTEAAQIWLGEAPRRGT